MEKHFSTVGLILLSTLLVILPAPSHESCWRQRQGVLFPHSYVIIGDANVLTEFRQVLLVSNKTTGKLELPKTDVNVSNEDIEFDSADVGPDKDSTCYSVRHEKKLAFSVKETSFDIRCKSNRTIMSLRQDVKKSIISSIFVDATGENVFWRNLKSPGEVHVTSIDREKSMLLFSDTQDWAPDTPFFIDHRKRLIFWVNLGHRSISYSNLVAPSGPIATVPTNADTTSFNSMTLDLASGSIYWLVTSAEDTIYRYNFTGKSTTIEVVTSLAASSGIKKRSHLQFFNSTLSLLTKTTDEYQVFTIPLPISAPPGLALTCKDTKAPRIIHDFNAFKDKVNRTEPSCQELKCSDICLDGPKPQCVCPLANTTLTGRENNTCSLLTLGLVLQSPTGLELQIKDLLLGPGTESQKLVLAQHAWVNSNLTTFCYATFNSSATTSAIACKNMTDSDNQREILEVPQHQILELKHQGDADTVYWISKSSSNWCFGNSSADIEHIPATHCNTESLETAAIDTRNEAVFWQSGNTIKAVFLGDTPTVTKTIFSTNVPVTILLEETHKTLILVEQNGNATIVAYDDPEKFQIRNVHPIPTDGVNRTNFKYHCQRLYWLEGTNTTDNGTLKSYYFINGQTENVIDISKETVDYHLKTDPKTDCGSIEIHPEKKTLDGMSTVTPTSIPPAFPPATDFKIYIYIGAGIGGVVIIVIISLVTIFMRSQSTKRLQERFVGILFSSPEEHLDLDDNLNELKVALSKPFNQIIDRKVVVDENAIVGHGANTVIYRGHLGKESEQVAVKTVKVNIDDCSTALSDVVRDLKVCAHVGNHSHLLQFVGARVDKLGEGKIFAVFELSALGTLNRYLLGLPQTADASRNVLSLMLGWSEQIATGMQFLEEKGIPHGDLRTKNVYVFPNLVKLANFGLSGNISRYHKGNHVERSHLPWQWMAIESLQFNDFSLKSDVWSYAVTMWEIFSFGEVPYSGRTWNEEFMKDIRNGVKLNKPKMTPVQVYEKIMMPCWQFTPDRRPTFASFANSESFRV